MNHVEIIQHLIDKRQFKSYLEIGCAKNFCFKRIVCPCKVGVDPNRGGTVRLTSDDYFRGDTDRFDCIFIDGLHHHKQVYRDICNSLNILNPNGIVVVHDLNPTTIEMQTVPRPENQEMWTGDCWRAWLEFRSKQYKYNTYVVDCSSGVGVISHNGHDLCFNPNFINKLNWNMTYDEFSKNRKELLNLITEEEFLNVHN